jgi:hypothetical protein
MMRAIVLSATLAALFTLWMQPEQRKYYPGQGEIPLIVNDPIDYCWITFKQAFQDKFGIWHFGFGPGYGRCELLDRYEDV